MYSLADDKIVEVLTLLVLLLDLADNGTQILDVLVIRNVNMLLELKVYMAVSCRTP